MNGANLLAYRVTVDPWAMMAADMLAPYPIASGNFQVQIGEEPIAAAVRAHLALGPMAPASTHANWRLRPGATVAAFFVADETGANDDNRYFSLDQPRWGTTYAARLASATNYFRTNNSLTFGMVNTPNPAVMCVPATSADMRRCVIVQNGGAYLDIARATDADATAAMARIVSAVAGAASQYRLTRTPITSTIKVRVRGMDVPRSRANATRAARAAAARDGRPALEGQRLRLRLGRQLDRVLRPDVSAEHGRRGGGLVSLVAAVPLARRLVSNGLGVLLALRVQHGPLRSSVRQPQRNVRREQRLLLAEHLRDGPLCPAHDLPPRGRRVHAQRGLLRAQLVLGRTLHPAAAVRSPRQATSIGDRSLSTLADATLARRSLTQCSLTQCSRDAMLARRSRTRRWFAPRSIARRGPPRYVIVTALGR